MTNRRGTHTRFRPFKDNGRRTVAGIMLVFALYTGVSLLLSARTAKRSDDQSKVLQIAARQRTLTERYAKEVLLALAGAPSAATPIAHDLETSATVLLDGGAAPVVAGDDDGLVLDPVTGASVRRQLQQERSLIRDLVATGSALLAGQKPPTRLLGHEHLARTMAPLTRLSTLTGLTSNVSLNVARSMANTSDRNVSKLISLQRLLACLGLAVFGILGWALVASTRRRSAHFRSLVASTTDLVLAFSDAQCRYASNSVLQMIGRDEAAVFGDGIIEFVHSEDRSRLLNVLRTADSATVEFRLQDAKRGWRALEANITDLREDRHVRGIVLNARDITERNRIEMERERLLEQELEANERLRELDGLKDGFVALVSHEVRTPLTSILGYLELLMELDLNEEQRSYTNIIGRNSDRLLRLTNDLLFIAQIEDGQLTVERDRIDLGPIIAEALAAAAPRAKAGEVEIAGFDDVSLPITGDGGRLAQLLDNLISNAVKFTPAGGRVEVAAGSADDRVWIEVRDTGIGIDADDQERLFNKFFRTRAATKASIQGTGLGLAISKAIVQAHGGSIHVQSAEGEGTTFRVELPVGLRAPSPASAPAVNA
jgi:PAS domain S-box-containing protein